jgi:hypothetical protein
MPSLIGHVRSANEEEQSKTDDARRVPARAQFVLGISMVLVGDSPRGVEYKTTPCCYATRFHSLSTSIVRSSKDVALHPGWRGVRPFLITLESLYLL